VDFELSDEQQALQEAARDLLDGYSAPAHVRAHLASGLSHDQKLWTAMLEQGWMGITTELGFGWVEASVLLEEVGRHTAPAPYLPSLLALSALGDTPWAVRLQSGDAIGCAAWGRHIEIGPGPTLSGRPDLVLAADEADVAVVWTPQALFAVDLTAAASAKPAQPARQPAMDQTRSLAWLELDATPATEIGGPDAAAALLDRAAVGFSAEMLGGAARVLEMSADYAKDRVQFGQPIGSFQAVKHRCADMVVDVEGMRSTTWYAAWCLDAANQPDQPGPPDEVAIAASSAKAWCADAAKRVMASGLQVHGGIGFTWEHDLHLFLKRSQLDQVSFGDAAYHRDRLAALLRSRVQAGQSVI